MDEKLKSTHAFPGEVSIQLHPNVKTEVSYSMVERPEQKVFRNAIRQLIQFVEREDVRFPDIFENPTEEGIQAHLLEAFAWAEIHKLDITEIQFIEPEGISAEHPLLNGATHIPNFILTWKGNRAREQNPIDDRVYTGTIQLYPRMNPRIPATEINYPLDFYYSTIYPNTVVRTLNLGLEHFRTKVNAMQEEDKNKVCFVAINLPHDRISIMHFLANAAKGKYSVMKNTIDNEIPKEITRITGLSAYKLFTNEIIMPENDLKNINMLLGTIGRFISNIAMRMLKVSGVYSNTLDSNGNITSVKVRPVKPGKTSIFK